MRWVIYQLSLAVVRVGVVITEFFRSSTRFFTAVAWGVANRSDVVQVVSHRYDRERDLKEEELVLKGLFPWEEKLYDRHLPMGSKVGLVGCGAGRDVIGLVHRGHQVDGMDLSPDMIQAAQGYLSKAGVKAHLDCADIGEYEFPGQLYGAFIFSNFTYVLIPGSLQRIEILRKLRSRLLPNGQVIVFYFNDQLERESQVIRVARRVASITGNPTPLERGDEFSQYGNFQHHFTHEEIARETTQAGYEIDVRCAVLDGYGFAVVLRPLSSEMMREAQS